VINGPTTGLGGNSGGVTAVVVPATAGQAAASASSSSAAETDGNSSGLKPVQVEQFFLIGHKQDPVLDFVLNPINGSLDQGLLATDLALV
jgi:hypothetical protein